MNNKHAANLLNFINQSPSPWHAVASTILALEQYDFQPLSEADRWSLQAGGRYYVVRDGSSIIAFVIGDGAADQHGFRLVGAHTDSPGLRVKPHGPHDRNTLRRLGVEIYGSPILATFTDRDLRLAGRIAVRGKDGQPPDQHLVKLAEKVRLPNAAIHLNKGVNTEGLLLDKQIELPLLLGMAQKSLPPIQQFRQLLASQANVKADDILSWELQAADAQPGEFFGMNQAFIASSQLDNLASCHAGMTALLHSLETTTAATKMIAFFDHEEVGSESLKGADGSFLPDVTGRILSALDINGEAQQRALHHSFLISADMAHAWHPGYTQLYEDEHNVHVNHGPAIKINVSQRYATDSLSEASFQQWCEQADVPFQKYVHRNNLPCGSTIGPISAARLGLRTVDVGNPMWAMHSARESAGALDHGWLIEALKAFWS